jgi:glucose/arabinose dehydrogenase
MKIHLRLGAALLLAGSAMAVSAQNAPPAAPPAPPPAPPPAGAAPADGGIRQGAQMAMPAVAKLGDGPWDIATQKAKVHVELVVRGIDHPWGLVFLPNGDMLVTERPGRLRVIRKGKLDLVPIGGLPAIDPTGIGGLHDIALDPNFATNGLIYMAYTKPDPDPAKKGNETLAVLRAHWDGGATLDDVRDIFVADAWYGARPIPAKCCGQGPPSGSFGGRLAFDKAGHLFITSGDRNWGERVQDGSNDFGKVVRIWPDGSVPKDNPFVGKAGFKPHIWTLGHRNQLGLFMHPETGVLWESEFGPRGGDEVNIIEKGKNYGWPWVTQGHHYNDEPPKLGNKNVEGMTDPVTAFGPPSINPGNLLIYTGKKFAGWKGDLLLPNMSRTVIRLSFDAAGKPVGEERMLGDLKQRFRDIRMGPDGNLYLLTDESDGVILKLTPGK